MGQIVSDGHMLYTRPVSTEFSANTEGTVEHIIKSRWWGRLELGSSISNSGATCVTGVCDYCDYCITSSTTFATQRNSGFSYSHSAAQQQLASTHAAKQESRQPTSTNLDCKSAAYGKTTNKLCERCSAAKQQHHSSGAISHRHMPGLRKSRGINTRMYATHIHVPADIAQSLRLHLQTHPAPNTALPLLRDW